MLRQSHPSPLHRPLPAVAITTWSELSYALQPAPVSQTDGRTNNATSPTRPRHLASAPPASSSTTRYTPYAIPSKAESSTKSSGRRKSQGDVLSSVSVTLGKTGGRSRSIYPPEIDLLRPLPSRRFGGPDRPLPTFPEVIDFKEARTRASGKGGRGVPVRSVLEGKAKLTGEKDVLLKHWPHEILLLKVPVSISALIEDHDGEGIDGMDGQGAFGSPVTWEIEVNVEEGQITRMRLLQAAAKAIASCCFPVSTTSLIFNI